MISELPGFHLRFVIFSKEYKRIIKNISNGKKPVVLKKNYAIDLIRLFNIFKLISLTFDVKRKGEEL